MRADRDPVKVYLQEIGRVPLLTHEQELSLGQQIQVMLSLKPPFSPEDQEILRQGQKARDRLIRSNLRLVVMVAKKYVNRGLDFQDLIQEGNIGLVRAAEKFDPEKGYKFSTYAYWWIRQGVARALAEKSRSIRLPVHITESLNKVKKLSRQFSQVHGRSPSLPELAESMNLSVEGLQKLLALQLAPFSIDKPVGEKSEESFGEFLPSSDLTPTDYIEQQEVKAAIAASLDCLTPREREILSLRFGIGGCEMRSGAIATELKISRAAINQFQRSGLKRLKRSEAITALVSVG